MALIKSSLLADIRGSIGGTTYSRNRGGSYARNRTVPINPQSANQERARSSLSDWSTYWSNSLNNTQRAAWNQFAETVVAVNVLGESITYTGQQMFIRSSTLIQLAGSAPITDPPETNVGFALSAAPQVVSHDVSSNTVTLILQSNIVGTVLAFCGPPQSAGSLSLKVPYRFFGSIFVDDANEAVVVGTNLGRRVFVAGQNQSWRFTAVDSSGRVSNDLYFRGLSVA